MLKFSLFGFRVHLRISRIKSRRLAILYRRVAQDYRRGSPVPDIAVRYGLTVSRIYGILAETGARQRRWRKMSPELRQEICRAVQAGQSKAEAGRKFGVSRERVRQIVQKQAARDETYTAESLVE